MRQELQWANTIETHPQLTTEILQLVHGFSEISQPSKSTVTLQPFILNPIRIDGEDTAPTGKMG